MQTIYRATHQGLWHYFGTKESAEHFGKVWGYVWEQLEPLDVPDDKVNGYILHGVREIA